MINRYFVPVESMADLDLFEVEVWVQVKSSESNLILKADLIYCTWLDHHYFHACNHIEEVTCLIRLWQEEF
jgi:hypothetical protein